MAEERTQRHLAAIFAADVVGYARLMEQDEADTFARLRAHRKELFEPEIAKHRGRVFKLMGDGLLAEFGSVVDAVECAVVLQRGMAERNNGVPEDRRIDVRIGVNLGDVIVEGEDRHGEGVVIAARLQELAAPGGIAISRQTHDQVEAKLNLAFDDLGKHPVKNIAKPVHVYRVREGASRAPRRRNRRQLSMPYAVIALIALVAVVVLYLWPDQVAPAPGPRIVVLPFSVTGGEPCNPAFSEGLARDIGAALLMFGNVSVISGNTIGQVTGQNPDAHEYGYKLDGSIECSPDGLRVAAQLFDANGNEVASEIQESSRSDANVSKTRVELAGRLAGGIASPTTPLWKSEEEKTNAQLERTPTDDLRSYRCVLLSYAYYNTFSAKAHKEARECLENAVNTTKNNALAWARLGAMYFEEHKYGHNPRPGRDPLRDARDAAQRAIEINSQMAEGYYVLALVYYYSEKDFESFHEMANKAIEKNAYNGWIIGDLGVWTCYSGDWERGKAGIETARAIYPDDPRWLDFPGVLDHYRKGEYREAKAAAHALELSQNGMVQEVLAATYGQLGEIESAKKKVDEIRMSHPELEANPRAPFLARKIPADLIEAIVNGLNKAGLKVTPAGEPPSR
jgi:class 3 adenylate cyclase/tetratricopeptide (TPR) repeat protein